MKAVLTHKIALDPTPAQRLFLIKAVGIARFAYNWALAEWKAQYEAGGKPNEGTLRRQLNSIKHEQFPWMAEAPKAVPQQAIKNLGAAFNRFFRKQARYPRFKKRGIHDSARFDNGPGTFKLDGKRIQLPKIGWVKTFEALRFNGKLLSATVSHRAGRWFVAIPVEIDIEPTIRENQASVGIDLGISTAATLSTGEKIAGPKALSKSLKKLKQLSKRLSRKQKGSANRQKARCKIARLHSRISNVRNDWLHKTTSALVRDYSIIAIEDLNVRGMVRNHRLARAISDIGFFEFRRQLTYKSEFTGAKLYVADRWFPSSKSCSACGLVLDALSLSERIWQCECGAQHDRDINAALNLEQLARASCARSNACGEEGSGRQRKRSVKPASAKQESSLNHLIQV